LADEDDYAHLKADSPKSQYVWDQDTLK
jgi:hypothetical protein